MGFPYAFHPPFTPLNRKLSPSVLFNGGLSSEILVAIPPSCLYFTWTRIKGHLQINRRLAIFFCFPLFFSFRRFFAIWSVAGKTAPSCYGKPSLSKTKGMVKMNITNLVAPWTKRFVQLIWLRLPCIREGFTECEVARSVGHFVADVCFA